LSPTHGFVVCFALTLVSLGLAVWAAHGHRRRTHVMFVGCAVAMLGVTIVYALQMGKVYDLRTAGIITPIHLTLAKITTAAFLVPIVLGWRAWKNGGMLPLHKKLAWIVLAMTVLCAITGTIMILRSQKFVP
jgi:hypothetical protein